jgi:hypothetical protein
MPVPKKRLLTTPCEQFLKIVKRAFFLPLIRRCASSHRPTTYRNYQRGRFNILWPYSQGPRLFGNVYCAKA